MRGEDALGEGVQRFDRGGVDLDQRATAAVALLSRKARLVAAGLFELDAQAVAQLGGGRFGERDRREVAQFGPARDDELQDTLDEFARLARAGSRLNEQRRV